MNAQGPSPMWVTSSANPDTPPVDAVVDDPGQISDKLLDTVSIAIPSAAQMTFRHVYDLESTYDGGVLEISINGGAFNDVIAAGGSFVMGGYSDTISTDFGSPIGGRLAWSGNSGGYITTKLNLPVTAIGQNIKLRFRMASDDSVSATGWRIDSIIITVAGACSSATPTVSEHPTFTPTATATVTSSVAPSPSATASVTPAAVVQVGMGGTVYVPETVNIQVGDTVEWDWASSPHSVTSGAPGQPDGLFDSDIHSVPYTFSYTFMTAGSFPYYCRVHLAMMTGTVNVLGASPTPSATATAGGETPTPTPGPVQALNVSTRLRVLTDANVGIGGFIITGNEPKTVLLRGIGPSLSMVGVPNPLADPELELHGPSGFATITNDNWMDDPVQKALIMATGLQPSNNLESAIIATLPPGSYTGILKGKNNGIGVGLVELYDVGQAADSRLGNISTRGFVATGGDIMIAGFILGGNTGSTNVVVRGIGPSLTPLGVPNALANPQLELRNSAGTVIRSNNDWMDDPAQKALIMGAGLAPGNNLESAIYETLAPGQYTALLSGVNNGTGVALVEAYDLSAGGAVVTPTPGTPTPTATIGGTPVPTATATATATAGAACMENWDGVTAPALPAGWTATN